MRYYQLAYFSKECFMINILLADDHAMFLEGLRGLLVKDPGIAVIAHARNGREAVEMAAKHSPDLVLMDINMPDINGIDAVSLILKNNPEVRIIALTTHGDKRYVEGILNAGATGYVLKDSAFEELNLAIATVLSGECYVSPKLSNLMVTDFVRKSTNALPQADTKLSEREITILTAVAEGLSTKEIAAKFKISVKTVETHRHNLMKKLDLHTIADLTKYAIREGLVKI
jgi:two-component system response regulator NreC